MVKEWAVSGMSYTELLNLSVLSLASAAIEVAGSK